MAESVYAEKGKCMDKYRGPYLRKTDGRLFMVVIRPDGSKSTTSYARWWWLQNRGPIPPGWEVHHKDGDQSNDDPDNYVLLSGKHHRRITSKGRTLPTKGIERGWTHGTQYGWMKKKCNCVECEQAKRIWHEERNSKRRGTSPSKGSYGRETSHGDRLHYKRGCRCDLCKRANTEYNRELRLRKG